MADLSMYQKQSKPKLLKKLTFPYICKINEETCIKLVDTSSKPSIIRPHQDGLAANDV